MAHLENARLKAGLYLVATPIGNLRDMTLRGIETLKAMDVILCEDTRVSGKLLAAHGIKGPVLSVYNDHSADRTRPQVLQAIAGGKCYALISDAGTPLISDPGYKLVRAAQEGGLMVTSIPGANAPLTALQLSGLPSDKFSFLGFLPPKSQARRVMLSDWATVPGTLIIYETAPRLIESLRDMLAVFGPRPAAVARELTKMFEETRHGTISQLVDHYAENGAPKGEIVIVIGPPPAADIRDADIDTLLRKLLRDHSIKDAAAIIAETLDIPRKRAYEMALRHGDQNNDDEL